MPDTPSRRTAILTGASSGIGAALALELAGRGWDLGLTARRLPLLEELRTAILANYPQRRIEVRALDVTALDSVAPSITELATALGGIQMLIANAGMGGGKRAGQGHFATDVAIVQTNLLGAMATIDAVIPLFRAAGGGRIVGISSVAAFRGLPSSVAYSASKAGFHTYLEGIRGELAADGIGVTTISPGYIDTPINQHQKSRPFLIGPVEGARQLADLIERGVRHSTVPAMPWGPISAFMRMLPDAVWDRIAARISSSRP